MIEINLLPPEMRKQKKAYFNLDIEMSKLRIITGSAFVGILIMLVIFLSTGSLIRKKQILNLTAKETGLIAQKPQLPALNQELVILKAKMAHLEQISQRRFLWAEKLNQLSDLILPGMWFTRIHRDSANALIIEGRVITKKEEAMASVGKFMKKIRDDERFFKDFSDVKLDSADRKSIGERDVVDLRIVLYFNYGN